MRSHALADDLKLKQDDFITATYEDENGEREFIIETYKRKSTHANRDDGITHWTLVLRDGGQGNIKR